MYSSRSGTVLIAQKTCQMMALPCVRMQCQFIAKFQASASTLSPTSVLPVSSALENSARSASKTTTSLRRENIPFFRPPAMRQRAQAGPRRRHPTAGDVVDARKQRRKKDAQDTIIAFAYARFPSSATHLCYLQALPHSSFLAPLPSAAHSSSFCCFLRAFLAFKLLLGFGHSHCAVAKVTYACIRRCCQYSFC